MATDESVNTQADLCSPYFTGYFSCVRHHMSCNVRKCSFGPVENKKDTYM